MTEPSNLPDNQLAGDDDEVNLLDLLIVLAKHKKIIVGLPFVVAVYFAVYSLSIPNSFTANTRILPPQSQSSGSSSIMAQLGGLAGLMGGAARSPSDAYIAVLKSRTLADSMIQRFGLMTLWQIDIKHPSDVYKALAGATKITPEKDGTVNIEVSDEDPKRAADFANAYIDELIKLTSVLALTEASQRRLFFERQFAQAKDNLAKVEASARQALQQGGLAKVDDQARAMVESIVRLRAEITVKEVQIGAMRTFAADRNPELQLAQQQLESSRRELAKLEGTSGTKAAANGQSGPGAESLRFLRDVKYHEIIFDLLARQYEMAKLDEAKDSTVIQVLDKAIAPDRKSGPKRSLMVLFPTLATLLAVILWTFIREAMVKANSDPQQAARMQALKRYLAWR